MDKFNNNTFNIFDLLYEIIKRKKLFIIFSITYFIFISLSIYFNNKNIEIKKNTAVSIKIDFLKYELLPSHYLETNNLLKINEKLIIGKTNFMKNFYENKLYLDFIFFQYVANHSSEVKAFYQNFFIDKTTSDSLYLKAFDKKYLKKINNQDIQHVLNIMNIDLYNFILNKMNVENNLIESLEKTLMSKSSFFDHFYDQENFYLNKNPEEYLYISNNKIIENFQSKGKYDFFYKFEKKNELNIDSDILENQKLKLYVFFLISYIVIFFIMMILSYGNTLNTKLNKS